MLESYEEILNNNRNTDFLTINLINTYTGDKNKGMLKFIFIQMNYAKID